MVMDRSVQGDEGPRVAVAFGLKAGELVPESLALIRTPPLNQRARSPHAGVAARSEAAYAVAGPQSMNRGRKADIGKIVLRCEPSGCIRNRPDRSPISSRNTIHFPFGE